MVLRRTRCVHPQPALGAELERILWHIRSAFALVHLGSTLPAARVASCCFHKGLALSYSEYFRVTSPNSAQPRGTQQLFCGSTLLRAENSLFEHLWAVHTWCFSGTCSFFGSVAALGSLTLATRKWKWPLCGPQRVQVKDTVPVRENNRAESSLAKNWRWVATDQSVIVLYTDIYTDIIPQIVSLSLHRLLQEFSLWSVCV